ncbi:PREDICTED: serine protease gd-like [Vollenhovia emeryi]|uniref:serine protease gd-like n=1 Tax=Vollenhovia emeryi TaxID=411798 RepID=UPI0005F41A92|nr:PREDICTED: serine protease gd-like [Vollenhovia emeryi]
MSLIIYVVTKNNFVVIVFQKENFRLELAHSIKEFIEAVQQGRPLLYHVYFPSDVDFPILSALWFNNQQYCLDPKSSSGNITANLELGHIVYPPNKQPMSQNFQSWYRNSSNYRIDNPIYKSYAECGITSYYTDTTNRLIPNGEDSLPGQWPWVVAVYQIKKQKSNTTHEFKCGGSILTTRQILTVADCVMFALDQNDTVPPNMLAVVVGRFNLQLVQLNRDVIPRVKSYMIHPDYMHDRFTSDSNLAILTLWTPVEFNPFIRPICLWSGSPNLDTVVNRTGYVVGWGKEKFGNIEEQRVKWATIVSQETCLRSNQRFVSLTSNRTFCASSVNEIGPCVGDSGNGLVLLNNITGRYELRGILSGSLPNDESHFHCYSRDYAIYVDVAKYIPWIQQQIST